jgi:hypothetical protein
MAWKEGPFALRLCPAGLRRAAQIKVDDLLMEGARQADEWTLIQQKVEFERRVRP